MRLRMEKDIKFMAKKKSSKIKKKVKAEKKPESKELVHRTRIRVIGVGGGGGSIVSEIARNLKRVDFVVANTDAKALKEASKYTKILQFGQETTGGLGCGMNAKIGQKAAKDDKAKIAKLFRGIDLCLLVSSLGGGTGSGAAPEFAKIGREAGAMVFGIFTLPFKFEGGKKSYLAKNSLKKLIQSLNAVSIIPNENIFKIIDKKTPLKEAFSTINRRLSENLRGLVEMIYLPGLINIDFADVRTILDGRGKLTYLNSAESQGPNRVDEVLKELLKSPLNEYNIEGAEKILFNITSSQNIGMKEVEQVSKTISDFNRRAKIIFGVSQDNDYKDKIRISLLAVGCGREDRPKAGSPKAKKPQPLPQREKPKKKHKPKARPKKKTKKPSLNKKSASTSVLTEAPSEEEPDRVLTRRNALDLRKAVEEVEEEMEAKEKKWEIPAFLRRKAKNNEQASK
ncbi:MAG: Cell division protein FtsZ [Candidatus Roizmanbacteria bacterium GW2011_GWC2_41_7]|uniref:Cell division protein FtsZ n=1 Tax=Candidatus Roizmanbacteria bacterium GW2011_GWC2_41_7 TaxID=1618487 RepID=A0A0G0X1U3_9BACT|nr:MAG: Cell division protein FtsZ [Candidatus Roizmanbacteria bacterium GW2011_GWC2_41_7]